MKLVIAIVVCLLIIVIACNIVRKEGMSTRYYCFGSDGQCTLNGRKLIDGYCVNAKGYPLDTPKLNVFDYIPCTSVVN